jgi:hypothetical protein
MSAMIMSSLFKGVGFRPFDFYIEGFYYSWNAPNTCKDFFNTPRLLIKAESEDMGYKTKVTLEFVDQPADFSASALLSYKDGNWKRHSPCNSVNIKIIPIPQVEYLIYES